MYLQELAHWRQAAQQGLVDPGDIGTGARQDRRARRRIRELERELRRNDEARAETAALLVLSKNKGLSLLFQVNNLTDEPFRTEVSESTDTGLFFPEEYTRNGRQYMLGLRYEL